MLLDSRSFQDQRGEFVKVLETAALREFLGGAEIKEINLVRTSDELTFRGFHYQKPPFQEIKIVTVIAGRILDLSFDPMKVGETGLVISSFELDSSMRQILVVPKGFAHGYLTLEKDTQVLYASTEQYMPKFEGGYSWNSPLIKWSFIEPKVVSAKDQSWASHES